VLFAWFARLVALLLHQSAIAIHVVPSLLRPLHHSRVPRLHRVHRRCCIPRRRLVMPSIGIPVVTGFDIIAQKIKDVASEHAPPSSTTVAVLMATTGWLLHSSFQLHSSGWARVVARDDPILSDTHDGLAKQRRTGCVTPASASVDGSLQRSSSESVNGSSRRSSSGSVDGSLNRSSSGSVVSLLSGGSSTIASPTNLFCESMPLDNDVVPPTE
jgi:hypothetical protein